MKAGYELPAVNFGHDVQRGGFDQVAQRLAQLGHVRRLAVEVQGLLVLVNLEEQENGRILELAMQDVLLAAGFARGPL